MSTEELEARIKQYHETLVKERKVKDQLVKKLEAIREVVDHHRPRGRTPRTASKAAGIPFGLSSLVTAAFMPTDNAGDNPNSNADRLLIEVKRILG